jgi:hypothetical protein
MRWPALQYITRLTFESRTVPRAYDAATIDPPVRHRRAQVGTVLADSQDVVAVSMQDHTDAVDLHPLWVAVQRRHRQHRVQSSTSNRGPDRSTPMPDP